MRHYYHLFANGDDAKDFITSAQDFKIAFNRFGICAAAVPEVKILAFSIEESHPHALIAGEQDSCLQFKSLYEMLTRRYITGSRGDLDEVVFELELLMIDNEDYLRNVASYVIVQPTKDGKQIMPYDYLWGTGSMYFRPADYPPIWTLGTGCRELKTFGSLTAREQKEITHSKYTVPDSWIICQDLILPTNYVDIEGYQEIFRTCNCFRTYMTAGKKQLQPVVDGMANARGIALPDLEARRVSKDVLGELFGKNDTRSLTSTERLMLAKELRNRYRMSFRQISTLSRLPENEIRKYVR